MYITSEASNKVLMRKHQVLISINKKPPTYVSDSGTPCENRTHN